MASTDAKPIPQKNAAYRVTFPIYDADGDLVTGATGLDSEVSKDGGTFADCTNEATEIATSSGMYYLDLTSTEMNADTVAVIVKTSSSGAKTTVLVLYPEEAGDLRVNVTQVNGTNQTAGDIPALITTVDDYLDTEIAAIKAKTDNLPADPADASDIASSFSTVNSTLSTIAGYLDTEIAAILADTNELQADWANGGRLDLLIDAIKAKTDNLPADPADASDIAALISGIETKIDTIDDFLDTEVAAILADTNELQLDWVDGGRLDLLIDAIKAKTDNLPTDPADQSALEALLTAIDDYLDTEIAAIKAKTDLIPASPAATGDIPSANSVADALLDRTDGIETNWTLRQALRVILAALAGKLSGADSTSVAIRDVNDAKDRISATVDADGNRSAVSYDKT